MLEVEVVEGAIATLRHFKDIALKLSMLNKLLLFMGVRFREANGRGFSQTSC